MSIRVEKSNDHQPAFLSLLAVTGLCSAWEVINTRKVTLLPPGEADVVLAWVHLSLGQMPCFLLLLSPDATFHFIPWTEVLCVSPGKMLVLLFSFPSSASDTVSFGLFHGFALLKGFFFADVWAEFPPSWSHPLWLLSLLWAASMMDSSSWYALLGRTDGRWIISNCTLSKQCTSSDSL